MKKLVLFLSLLMVAAVILRGADQSNEIFVAKSIVFAGQTASITSTNEITPSVDTSYVVTFHEVVHGTTSGNSSVTPTLGYTNTLGNPVTQFPGVGASSGTVVDSIGSITVKGGTTVTFSATYNPGTSNDAYDMTFLLLSQ